MKIFFLISDWYDFALIELVRLPGELSIEVFSKKLGISNEVVADAMSGLERLGYIKKKFNGLDRSESRSYNSGRHSFCCHS